MSGIPRSPVSDGAVPGSAVPGSAIPDSAPAADQRPQRVRVTAPGSRAAPGTGPAGTRGENAAGSGADAPSQVAEVYVRSLIRSQLRLALVVAFGFLVSLAAFALVLRLTPELEAERWFGVPVAWLLLAFGVYPMIGLSAWLYVWAAGRNEARYTALAEEGP